MKNILKFFTIFLLFFSIWGTQFSYARILDDLLDDASPTSHICDNDDCSLQWWIEQVKDTLKDSVTDRNASDYIQDVIAFLLGFIALVAVIIIIYAWFNILTWAGDEEKVKKAKMTIIYVIVGIIVIYLAWPIFNFVVNVLNWAEAEIPEVVLVI